MYRGLVDLLTNHGAPHLLAVRRGRGAAGTPAGRPAGDDGNDGNSDEGSIDLFAVAAAVRVDDDDGRRTTRPRRRSCSFR